MLNALPVMQVGLLHNLRFASIMNAQFVEAVITKTS
jgi:hypothetical protein